MPEKSRIPRRLHLSRYKVGCLENALGPYFRNSMEERVVNGDQQSGQSLSRGWMAENETAPEFGSRVERRRYQPFLILLHSTAPPNRLLNVLFIPRAVRDYIIMSRALYAFFDLLFLAPLFRRRPFIATFRDKCWDIVGTCAVWFL